MKRDDALTVGEYILGRLKPFCLPEKCAIAGGTRRGKENVHDLEIVCQPDLSMKPRAQMGMSLKQLPAHKLAMELIELEEQEYLFFKHGQDRNRKYYINLPMFGLPTDDEFLLDLFIVLPPAQFGVQLVIRTGPNSDEDTFSKWVVTQRSKGGMLPDGYCISSGAVWRIEQTREANGKRIPLPGELPILMPNEEDFLHFIGVTAEPGARHARWGQYIQARERQ